ncbi:helix-turn-helix domain-containing protein [Hymenobacter psychrotolerans]|uniref:DNA-binding transcriptional regulator, XRE-family HTH domain n=1 Tax=Hymenobacter psychrotolerans DSM 18569 TaxID=1121959 RepID=A0A1M6PMH5_9BACT|nr:helix-turn-helix transcriptional regulator [Hymenobacter psychrotolerans]SHK09131.1 DNA-binding transcriptional regulator, XRE-family HTH domain [Hymenobacter psychrotolerans DSM 18569]
MARPLTHSLPSDTLEAAVRAHFGLSQEELARYLGVTRGLVAHLEAGRRPPTAAVSRRLGYLAALLPPPTGHGPAAPRFGVPEPLPPLALPALPDLGGAPDAAPLRRRLLQVRAQAARLRLALHQAGKGSALQQRREWGLALLRAALPPAEATAAAEQAHLGRWLAVLAADIGGSAATPARRAAQALALLRVAALEAEAAALTPLLGRQVPAGE